MNVQVEVEFTILHGLDELKAEFVQLGHFPDWKPAGVVEGGQLGFLETRVVSVNLSQQSERLDWFVFSMEACGELRRKVVIPGVIPSGIEVHRPELKDFLQFCRHCLVAHPA